MRAQILAIALVLPMTLRAGSPGIAAPAVWTHSSLASQARTCGQEFRCQPVHVQLCVKRPAGRNIWSLTHKDAQLRRGVSTRGCTEYAVGIGFTLRYNGRQAAVQKHSLTCTVQSQRTVHAVIRKCYSTVERSSQRRF